MLNRCVWCGELGAGELQPWPDLPWGLKAICEACAAIPHLAYWRNWWIRVLHFVATGSFWSDEVA